VDASHASGGRSGGWMYAGDRQDRVTDFVEGVMYSEATTNQCEVVVVGRESVRK
jgi:hypothetical protein